MKTLLIVSHPDIIESGSQQYFLSSIKNREDITIHHLESTYRDGKIDTQTEQELLKQHDRIIFQFPFYWYSSPPLLKHWQDVVLEEGFAYGEGGNKLEGKEFGIISMIGVPEREYQAGGKELYSFNELTKPFQAMAHKTGMVYLRPLTIYQFFYMEEEEKMDTLIKYWQLLTMENNDSLASREKWLVEQLRREKATFLENEKTIDFTIQQIEENRTTIDDLKILIDDMY